MNKFNLGYVENNMTEKALDLFERMPLAPDNVVYTIVLNACAQLANDRAKIIGKKLVDQMLNKFQHDSYLDSSAIHMLMKFGDVTGAEALFEMIKKKNTVLYGAMMKGYNINNDPLQSLYLFHEMKRQNIKPDEIIFVLLIGACSQIGMLSICQSIVAQIPAHFYKKNHIINSLIDMWASQ